MDPRIFLRDLFDTAVAAADPARLLPGRLPPPPRGRTVVIGAGKAAARMAHAVERDWAGPLEGLIVTRYGHGEPCERIGILEAAHPLPDVAGRAATLRILELVENLDPDDLVICLLSGGGSALLELTPPDISLGDIQKVSGSLLRSGASIGEINCVRKHLSLVKGGRLAVAAHPARVVTYIISDVPGDNPSTVASGPTVADPTSFLDALDILQLYEIQEPAAVLHHLRAGADVSCTDQRNSISSETPKPGDSSFAADEVIVLATAHSAIDATAQAARDAGVQPVVLGYDLEGEARELGVAHARAARDRIFANGPPRPPCVLLSGGETTVTVRGGGRGGRNVEYLLGLAIGLDGAEGVSALAADTDGIDGTEDNAGAFLTTDTLARARSAGLDPASFLARNDAYGFFLELDDLLITGPTRTNVNDFRAIVVGELQTQD